MSNAIKLSVIIPVYNVEKYLRQCLDSVLAQTLEDIEIILIDDGSKDSCPKIIDEYATKDSRIRVFHNTNCGYGKECNFGIDNSKGEYITILEPDDYIAPEMYKDLYQLATNNDADIAKSTYFRKFETKTTNNIIEIDWSNRFKIPNKVFKIEQYPYFLALHPSIWSAIYKKDFLVNNNIRFIEAPGSGWTDNPFQVEAMCRANRIVYTDKAYYYWRVTTDTNAEALKDYKIPFIRCDEIHEWLDNNKITNTNILGALYERELSYIEIVTKMKDITDIDDCTDRIHKMCNRMSPTIVYTSKYIRLKNKNLFFMCKYLPFTIKFNRFRRKFLKLRLNRNEQSISILGKKFDFTIKKGEISESNSN